MLRSFATYLLNLLYIARLSNFLWKKAIFSKLNMQKISNDLLVSPLNSLATIKNSIICE